MRGGLLLKVLRYQLIAYVGVLSSMSSVGARFVESRPTLDIEPFLVPIF